MKPPVTVFLSACPADPLKLQPVPIHLLPSLSTTPTKSFHYDFFERAPDEPIRRVLFCLCCCRPIRYNNARCKHDGRI